MRKPIVAIAIAAMVLGGAASAKDTGLRAGDRLAAPVAADSEDYLGFSALEVAFFLASIAAAIALYNELEDDGPDSP